jgi:hypothetical protein
MPNRTMMVLVNLFLLLNTAVAAQFAIVDADSTVCISKDKYIVPGQLVMLIGRGFCL